MRRKEQQITDTAELEAVFREAIVCRLALVDGGRPYIVPLSFGYRDGALYFHSAAEGRKLDLLRRNPQVGFELEAGVQVVPGKTACRWGVTYRSIIGLGRAEIVQQADEKRRGLDAIMAHYSPGRFDYPEGELARTTVIRVKILEMTGKRSA